MHETKFRAGWEAVNREDIPAVLDLLDPDIVWDMSCGFLDGPVYHGHAGVRQFFADVAKLWDEFRLEATRIVERPNGVAVLGHWAARGKGSDAPVQSPGGWYWRLNEHGKAELMRFHNDPQGALMELRETVTAPLSRARGEHAPNAFTSRRQAA
jgi:ketosteroid isomerase-like protein